MIEKLDFGSSDAQAFRYILLAIAAGHMDLISKIGSLSVSYPTKKVHPVGMTPEKQVQTYSFSLTVRGSMPDFFYHREVKPRYMLPLTQCLAKMHGAILYITHAYFTAGADSITVEIKTIEVPK